MERVVNTETLPKHQLDKAPTQPPAKTSASAPQTPHASSLTMPTHGPIALPSSPTGRSSSQTVGVSSLHTPRASTIRSSADTTNLCLMCPSKGKLVCEECELVTYCSISCMDADISAHQTLCSKNWGDDQRPDATMRRAIFFPDASARSFHFTWVKFEPAYNEDGEEYQTAQVGSYFGVTQDRRSSYYVTKNSVLSRPLSRTIRVIAANDNSPFAQINPSIEKLVDRNAYRWTGPLLALGLQGTASNPRLPIGGDIVMEDLRHVLDYLNTYRSKSTHEELGRYFGGIVHGVRINSTGDRGPDERPEFEAIRVPTTHFLFDQTHPQLLPIASQLEIPITYTMCQREKDCEALGEEASSRVQASDWNPALRDLKQTWLLESQEELAASAVGSILKDDMVAEYYGGSAILVRLDQKPLRVKQVEALWRFNKYLLEPKMTLASSSLIDVAAEKTKIEETYLNKTRFAQFYSDGQCFQMSTPDRTVPSPYEAKKRLGSLKRKTNSIFSPRGTKRVKWEWSSDGDEESESEKEVDDASD